MKKSIGKQILELLTAIFVGFVLLITSLHLISADNEIYIDQSGATSNLDIEQVGGSGNIIGGADATAGSSNMTPLDLDGTTMTLDILQKGSTNVNFFKILLLCLILI